MIANICVTYRLIIVGLGHNARYLRITSTMICSLLQSNRLFCSWHNKTVGGVLPTVKQKTVDIVLPTAWNQDMMR